MTSQKLDELVKQIGVEARAFNLGHETGFAQAIEMAAEFCNTQGEYDGEWFAEKIRALKRPEVGK